MASHALSERRLARPWQARPWLPRPWPLRERSLALLSAALLLGGPGLASACTTLAVGKAATADGSVLVTHTDDGENGGDSRLCYIPPADHEAGSMRPIYWDTEEFPRFVGNGRGTCYTPQPGQEPYQPIGRIQQVAHTYGYFEATYGTVNERGVGIGETTCSAVFATDASGHGGKALMSVDELTRIAMERSTTSREAVKLMGSLAEEYGFYGAGSFEGSGESLMVGDKEEAFVFHVLTDPTGASAVWAAQRVPDDGVAVVANHFMIREIDFADETNFLHSASVRSVALAKGWWKEGEPLDFTKLYSDGEYAHKFYSGRRVWGAYRLFGVDHLPSNYTDMRFDAVYPATAKLPTGKAKVLPQDLFAIHRDYYQGTEFDMTRGLAAGPWGDPDRWSTTSQVTGSWERSIGLFRTTSSHVVQCRGWGQGTILWFGPHAAPGTCYMPLAAAATEVPAMYTVADPNVLNKQSAYWAHRFAFNVAKIKYAYAMKDLAALQQTLEGAGAALVSKIDASVSIEPAMLNAEYARHAAAILQSFTSLPDLLVWKYADGWLADKSLLSYPDWWLEAVGYPQGPPPAPVEPPPGLGHLQSATVKPNRTADLAQPLPKPMEKLLMRLNLVATELSSVQNSNSCSDQVVQRCVEACPSSGFAKCAARCTSPCADSAATAAKDAATFAPGILV